MDRVTLTAQGLVDQAPMTVEKYMNDCIDMLDKRFGKGYAEKNPQLLGALIQSCVSDFESGCLLGGLQDIADSIGDLSLAIE